MHHVTGQPKIWQMMNWVVMARVFSERQIVSAETGDLFLNFNMIIRDRMRFQRAAQFEFTKALYDFNINKRPLFMTERGGYLGQSSWSTVIDVRNSEGVLLLTTTSQLTGVDPTSRRPKPLPESFKEKSRHLFNEKQLTFHKMNRPSNAGCYRARVNWIDIDSNEHATWHTYVSMTINGASKCVKEGSLRHFRQNKLNGLHKLELQFFGESVEGDELEVFIWEEPHVMISDVCKNGVTIFQGSFYFHQS